jgi:hypothetical protein
MTTQIQASVLTHGRLLYRRVRQSSSLTPLTARLSDFHNEGHPKWSQLLLQIQGRWRAHRKKEMQHQTRGCIWKVDYVAHSMPLETGVFSPYVRPEHDATLECGH